jgi:hypothetical protein
LIYFQFPLLFYMTDFDPAKYQASLRQHEQESPSKDLDTSTLEEYEVTDGKDRDSDEIQKMKDLEEVLGIRQMNPYGTLDRDIFDEKLADMTVTDMQSLAMQIGFPPTRDRMALKRGLRKNFDAFLKSHSVGAVFQAQPIFDQNSPNYKETVRLFE